MPCMLVLYRPSANKQGLGATADLELARLAGWLAAALVELYLGYSVLPYAVCACTVCVCVCVCVSVCVCV